VTPTDLRLSDESVVSVAQRRYRQTQQRLSVSLQRTAAAAAQLTTTRQSQTADSAPCAATWEVTLSARKVVPCVRWPATGITVQAQFIAKPKAACALRFSWAATSSNLGL